MRVTLIALVVLTVGVLAALLTLNGAATDSSPEIEAESAVQAAHSVEPLLVPVAEEPMRLAAADGLYDQGVGLMNQAALEGVGEQRDALYSQAADALTRATNQYHELVEASPDDAELLNKATKANQLRYAAIKSLRF